MNGGIAIVGMACEFADATSPQELWQNVLARRVAFRRIPESRLPSSEYISQDASASDYSYCGRAAVISNYLFDRVKYRISGDTFRSTDLTHWMALDIASRALLDARFPAAQGLPAETTGVLVGNTLTSEFSRAESLRLRWPYVSRMVSNQLEGSSLSERARQEFLRELEARYKAPFAPTSEETLAGALSNTIAGRICNHYNLGGGGFVVDGACSSSLLAVAQACSALASGELDAALVGGVDLSLDPFELVGFSRVGALARDEMRVYDKDATGFLPGEGCGFVVLLREEDAWAEHRDIYATIKGWAISSDGHGGLTRPEPRGQLRALERAYRQAGYSARTVKLFEGHGTGTAVGDTVELTALSHVRGGSHQKGAAAVGSVKANIGHTKAAAGIAGLIKASMAVRNRLLPPTTGNRDPHPILRDGAGGLRVLKAGEMWPEGEPVRAGISAFGFGGINVHVTIEGRSTTAHDSPSRMERTALTSHQDCELILLAAESIQSLLQLIDRLLAVAQALSRADLTDLAAHCASDYANGAIRAAVVTSDPDTLHEQLLALRKQLYSGAVDQLDAARKVFIGSRAQPPRLLLLFPGQASPVRSDGGIFERRFPEIRDLYARHGIDFRSDPATAAHSTDVAQPAIVLSEIAGLQALRHFGVRGDVALGHSLGELVALHWSSVFGEQQVVELARHRGLFMSQGACDAGGMAAIGASAASVGRLIADIPGLNVAARNAPTQTVVSGDRQSIERAMAVAQEAGLLAAWLPVRHAFHSPHMTTAAHSLARYLETIPIAQVAAPIFSTVTGDRLPAESEIRKLLAQQLTAPVSFVEALERAAPGVDLAIEVVPGGVLTELARTRLPLTVSLDVGGDSLSGLLTALGTIYALGGHVDAAALFSDRLTRSFRWDVGQRFFSSPCGSLSPAPEQSPVARAVTHKDAPAPDRPSERSPINTEQTKPTNVMEALIEAIARRAEIPKALLLPDTNLLADLHLNSITVGQIVVDTARKFGIDRISSPADFARARIGEIVETLQSLIRAGGKADPGQQLPDGLADWVRSFVLEWQECEPLQVRGVRAAGGFWHILCPFDPAMATTLQQASRTWCGSGVAVCVPAHVDGAACAAVLAAAARLLGSGRANYLLLVQPGAAVAAFFRSVHLENARLTTCVVDAPMDDRLLERIVEELPVASGYHHVRYTDDGRRWTAIVRNVPIERTQTQCGLTDQDVVLVSGGGKGIAAECAFALAKNSGARLLLLGRSDPASDATLRSNLERLERSSLRFEYVCIDVSDRAAVCEALRAPVARLGAVTAIIHAAGVNQPKLAASLDEADILETWDTKVEGLRNLLAAVDRASLRLLVGFGSIIARSGLRGEAHYALANDALAREVNAHAGAQGTCRGLTLEWSVWSDVGMGERLGSAEALARDGIRPIPPDIGVQTLLDVLNSNLSGPVIIASRVPDLPTLTLARQALPMLRFIERPRVHFSGIELVADAIIAPATDPYIEDHIYGGQRLLPAVVGLEAMAQAARALVGGAMSAATFKDVRFNCPIIVPPDGSQTLRTMAIVRAPDTVEVALRCVDSGYATDHFRASCRLKEVSPMDASALAWPAGRQSLSFLGGDLYNGFLFQRRRFSALTHYHTLEPRACCFEVRVAEGASWFGPFLPSELLLGDPGSRDAAIHGIQACVPHEQLLPVAVDSINIKRVSRRGTLLVNAIERGHLERDYVYDLDIRDQDGVTIEMWRGLRLRSVGQIRHRAWDLSLLRVHVERRAGELLGDSELRVMIQRAQGQGDSQSRLTTVRELLGPKVCVHRREDGRLVLLDDSRQISVSHSGDLTLAVSGQRNIGCDLQLVETRSEGEWSDLLGRGHVDLLRAIADQRDEPSSFSATRIWAVRESLKKSGLAFDAPLSLDRVADTDDWMTFRAGSQRVATCVAEEAEGGHLALAIAIRADS